jgi:2-succinyl-6-hydroxy-2,4-cyclohexadiene-1-carboxylate synthase
MKLYIDHVTYYLNIHQYRRNLPYLLMIHGFMGSGRSFEPLIQLLSSFCNPVTIDLLGHDRTGGPDDPERYVTEKQIRDIKSILQRLNLHPLVIYGYSMGGRLSINLLLELPGYFQGAVFESTTCGISDRNERKLRARIDEERATEIEKDYHVFIERWMENPIFKKIKQSENLEIDYSGVMINQQPELMAASLRGFGTGNMQSVCERLSSIHQDVLLIAGKEDLKFIEIHRKMNQLIPNARSVEIAGAGHRVHLDQTKTFTNEINRYLNHLSL